MKISNKTTIKDVAHRAGVAWSTASYALNGGPKPVGENTRTRVLAVARELGYSSNLLARSLVTGRVEALGVLVPDLHSHIANLQLAGVEEAAQQYGYQILLATHLEEPDRALSAQKGMTGRRMDGILLISQTADMPSTILEGLSTSGLPYVVTYHKPVNGVAADCVTVDQGQGGYLATRHLLDSGRRTVAFVGPLRAQAARTRCEGYRRAYEESSRGLRQELVIDCDGYGTPDGFAVGHKVFSLRPRPDAIFAASDRIAAGILRACHGASLRVPEDVAVVGFDDLTVLCEALDPPLSSVHMPLEEMGRESVRRLIARVERPDEWQPVTQLLPCALTQRKSG